MHILHLEDDAFDAELVRETFLSEWPDCKITLVEAREEYCDKLLHGGYDLILSDFNLRSFDGLSALQAAREKCPQVPFIFLSGTIGEDRAVEAMRNGASDYVLKDRPKRLVPAVKRALENVRLLRERKAAEEQLLRVQRLENIGMLAAGIAHDFNNVLAPVLMAVPLLRDQLPNEEQVILSNIEKSVKRGAGLVKQILGFARGVTGEPIVLQPKHLLRDLLSVLRQTFPKTIRIEEDLERELWQIRANATQLHQVLLNLCVNARDAMPEGGVLRLSAHNRELDAEKGMKLGGAKPGPYVEFSVEDTGSGIPPELQSRIWEPFFTTKAEGRGTGLGLPTVRGIVENHQGAIELSSELGKGTRFRVYFPADPHLSAEDEPPPGSYVHQGNDELILVVDDDENLRNVVSTALTRNGYRVLAAGSGTEAVSLYAPRSLEIRAVIVDLGLPLLDGFSLARIIASLNPSARLLFVSGLADSREKLQAAHLEAPFLAKPFTTEQLQAALANLLAPQRGAPTAR